MNRPLNTLVGQDIERQRRQVDFRVPVTEEPVVGVKLDDLRLGEHHASQAGAKKESLLKLARRHADWFRLTYADKTAMAAGVTPGMREAWPSVSGRT